jgi:hypothetical protein
VGHGIGLGMGMGGMDIASGIFSILPLLKILKGVGPGFAKGGIVPYGHLNDSFPAMLTSREFVVPEEKLDVLLKETPNAKHLKKTLTDQLPKLASGGVIPTGFPNDSYPALLTSGEIVVPPAKLTTGNDYAFKLLERLDKLITVTVTGNKDLLSKGWLEGKTSPLKITDKRITDLITGQPVKDTGRLGGQVDPAFVAEVVQKSMQRGMDPYTALAISHQETGGFKKDYMDNPFSILWPNPEELAKYDLDPIGYSLDFLADKLKLAEKLGKKTFAEQVQFFNGTGRIMPDTFGRPMKKVYGVDIPPEGISMKENPLYGKRVEDIRNNILLQNTDLVRLVDSVKKGKGQSISNPEDLMSLNTSLSQTSEWYKLATEGAMAFGTAMKVTAPMIQAQTQALTTQTTISKENPMISPVPIPKIPTLGSPNRLLENGLAPPPVMPTGNDAAMQIVSLLNGILGNQQQQQQQQQQTGKRVSRGNKIASGISKMLMNVLQGYVMGGPFGAILGGVSGLTGLFGMAQGGIIPAGYPNDTYPAMLSSHEAVIPLDKLNRRDDYEFEPVTFEIAGDRLEGILRKRMKKTSTY